MSPQPDFNEILRRRRLAQLMGQQDVANTAVTEEPPPQIPPVQPYQMPSEVSQATPFNIPGQPVKSTARQQYEEMLSQGPKLADYHPSRARQIGSIVGGILGGIGTRSVGGGIDIGTRIKYGPYTRQQKEFEQKIGPLKAKAESEKVGIEESEKLAQREAEVERKGAERARRQKEEFEVSPEGREFELEKIRAQRGPSLEKELYNLELQDNNKVRGARYIIPEDVKTQPYYLGPDGNRYSLGSIKSAEKQSPEKMFTNDIQMAYDAFARDHGRTPTYDEALQIVEDISKRTGVFEQRTREKEEGTWVEAQDPQGNPILYNNKTGAIKRDTGIVPKGTAEKKEAQEEKMFGPAKQAIEYADDYMKKGIFSGTGDEALMEKFFELAKPSSGFRMTDAQIRMLKRAQNAMNSISAAVKHQMLPHAPWFSDQLRQDIYFTMQQLSEAKLKPTQKGIPSQTEYKEVEVPQ